MVGTGAAAAGGAAGGSGAAGGDWFGVGRAIGDTAKAVGHVAATVVDEASEVIHELDRPFLRIYNKKSKNVVTEISLSKLDVIMMLMIFSIVIIAYNKHKGTRSVFAEALLQYLRPLYWIGQGIGKMGSGLANSIGAWNWPILAAIGGNAGPIRDWASGIGLFPGKGESRSREELLDTPVDPDELGYYWTLYQQNKTGFGAVHYLGLLRRYLEQNKIIEEGAPIPQEILDSNPADITGGTFNPEPV
jgi:hypothetical protein